MAVIMEAAEILRQTARNLPDTDPSGQSRLTPAADFGEPLSNGRVVRGIERCDS